MIKILILAALFVSANAFAAETCVQVPAGLKYKSLNPNGDGSVTLTEPRFAFDGKYLAVSNESAPGICALLKKTLNFSTNESMDKDVIVLNSKGQVSGIEEASSAAPTSIVDKITCN
jgi:hypothetical protein